MAVVGNEISFTIGDSTYVCEHEPTMAVLAFLIGAVRLDDRGERHYSANQILGYLALVLNAESQRRLLVAIHRKTLIMPLQTLGVAVMWVVEQQTLRSFGHARTLALWSLGNWGYMRGRLLSSGVDPDQLNLRDLLDITYVTMLEDIPPQHARAEARRLLDKTLDSAWVDRESWGLTASAEAAQRAMMEQVPPAQLRDPKARRPNATPRVPDPGDPARGADRADHVRPHGPEVHVHR